MPFVEECNQRLAGLPPLVLVVQGMVSGVVFGMLIFAVTTRALTMIPRPPLTVTDPAGLTTQVQMEATLQQILATLERIHAERAGQAVPSPAAQE